MAIDPTITYSQEPKDHNSEARALPTAPKMKLLTTKTVFNLLLSSFDRLNSLACANTDTPWTAIENTPAIMMIAIIDSLKINPNVIDIALVKTNIPSAGTLKPLSWSFPRPIPNTAAVRPLG